MITIESITIHEFRGIRQLNLSLNSKSFAVWGPNGSGKSGVVDAIDFALTGSIARLSGSGSGGVTVTKHGPHVQSRDKPQDAWVELGFRSTKTGAEGVLRRSISSPKTYSLTPDSVELRQAVDDAASHPEITLTRRDIIKFVAAEAGARAREVQALLKLDRLGDIRRELTTTRNKVSSHYQATASQLSTARDRVKSHFDTTALARDEILDKINGWRETVEVDQISALESSVKVDGNLIETSGRPFNKTVAIRDLSAFSTRLDDAVTTFNSITQALRDRIEEVEASPGTAAALRLKDFWETGLDLVEDATCPFCDQEWSTPEELRDHVAGKVAEANEAGRLRTAVIGDAQAVSNYLNQLRESIAPCREIAVSQESNDCVSMLDDWKVELGRKTSLLNSFDGIMALDREEELVKVGAPSGLQDHLTQLSATVEALPDQSARASAVSNLHIAQERLQTFWQAEAAEVSARKSKEAADQIYTLYIKAFEEELTALYDAVETEFSAYYRKINADDESSFRASLKPAEGKLEMEVDFYGIGMFPPMAYHSEGHQDGMGVCLYLALMKHLLGNDFRLAVLDDVVMSVDSNHRKQFCTLLKEDFPEVQFVITTHDQLWAMWMRNAGLVTGKAQAHFFRWSVETGPSVEQDDFWDRIDEDLERDNVSSASATLRRNLEAITGGLVTNLGGRVLYKPANDYDLGDFLAALKGRHKDLLKRAAESAQSWGNEANKEKAEALETQRKEVEKALSSEEWAVNKMVHFNEWATLTSSDFRDVVNAYKKFVDQFHCVSCGAWMAVGPGKDSPDTLSCPCQATALSLKKRPT